MAVKKNAVVLGRMVCSTEGCGETCAVKQSVREYLYTQCPKCKANQSNSSAYQVYVWQHLEPLEGAVIVRPHNVPESAGSMGCALAGDAPVAVEVESKRKPVEPVAVEVEQEGKPASGLGLFICAVLGAVVGFAAAA